ncbi:MAG: hypothetical protein AAFZ63_12610, partial [Bacteroidota bacterium]
MATPSRREYWSEVLSTQAASGLSKKAFCADRGINAATFYYWQRRLRTLAQDERQAVFEQLLPQKEHELSLQLSSGEVVVRSRSLAALSQVLQA